MEFLSPLNFPKKKAKPNARKAAQDRFGILARSMHTFSTAPSARTNMGWSWAKECFQNRQHAKRYPAFHLHPMICKKHQQHWTMGAGAKLHLPSNFGKGQVLFTLKEGGTWQKWPWNWVPEKELLDQVILTANTDLTLLNPDDKHSYGINVHSLLIDGRRWDCINGWTD